MDVAVYNQLVSTQNQGYDVNSDSFKYLPNSYFKVLMAGVTIADGVENPGIVIPLTGLKRVFVMATGTKIYDLYSYPSPDGSTWMEKEVLGNSVQTTSTGKCIELSKLAPYANITIKNVDSASGTFNLWVYGI